MLLVLNLGFLTTLVSALMVVEDARRHMVESVVWLDRRRLVAKVYLFGAPNSQFAVGVVQAPVHASIVWPLLRLLVDRILVPRDLVLERRLLI